MSKPADARNKKPGLTAGCDGIVRVVAGMGLDEVNAPPRAPEPSTLRFPFSRFHGLAADTSAPTCMATASTAKTASSSWATPGKLPATDP